MEASEADATAFLENTKQPPFSGVQSKYALVINNNQLTRTPKKIKIHENYFLYNLHGFYLNKIFYSKSNFGKLFTISIVFKLTFIIESSKSKI